MSPWTPPRHRSVRGDFARLLAIALAVLSGFGPAGTLHAGRLPSYSQASQALPAIWQKRYPVQPREFRANPGGRGVIRATFQSRYVYYYRFEAIVARPLRDPETQAVLAGDTRTVEFWARYREWLPEPWDLSFVREDRLPGTSKRWLQVGR